MEALIDSGFDSDLEAIREMSRATDVETLKAGFREMACRYSDDPENTLWSLEFQLAAVRHPELRSRYARQYDRLRTGVGEMLVETFHALGHPSPEEARRFADVFVVILSGLSLTKLLYPDTFADSLFEDAFSVLVEGIRSGGTASRRPD